MKKILKKLLIIVLILGLLFGGYSVYKRIFGKKNNVSLSVDMNRFDENLADEVTKKDMVSSLNFVGSTKIKNQQKLKFNYESRVTGVFKKVGDSVKQGNLIVELDKSSIYSQVEILKLSVQNAELKLKELLENNSEIEVKKSRINLEKLKENLENFKSNLSFFEQDQKTKISDMEKTLKQKETEYRILQEETKVSISQINLSPSQKEQELQKSKNSLATLELEYERDKNNFDLNFARKENEYFGKIEKEYLAIDGALRSLSRSFNKLDELIKIMPDKNYDNSYSIYYSAKNNNHKSESSIYFQRAYSGYKKLENQIMALKNKNDIKKLIELIDLELEMYTNLSIAGEHIMKGLDNSIETADFNNAIISSFYGEASNIYSESNSKIISLKALPIELKTSKNPEDLKKDMENELRNKKDQIEDLKISIKKQGDDAGLAGLINKDKLEQESRKLLDKAAEIKNYKIEIDKTKVNNEYELESKKKSISETELQIIEAERSLKNLLNDSSNQVLVHAQNDLKQSRISLENEQKKLETYEIKAPFDGVITKIDYQVGDNLVQNDEKYILLENPDILEISIFVDQVDVMKLSVGQKALVKYDSFPGKEFNAEIVEIDTTPQDKDGLTKYQVKVSLEKQEQVIFSGMKAEVSVIIQKLSGVLGVPFLAVNTNQETGETFVVVLNSNKQKEQRVVKTGYSDGTYTEILEGLKEGEKVLRINYEANKYNVKDFESDNNDNNSFGNF